MNIHWCITMYNSKQLYWFKRNTLTYLDYDNNSFNNDECGFKLKFAAGMLQISNANGCIKNMQ